ncbi:toxin co-regulated pilus biosynthesis Q family protein, partial [Bordetella pertussis]|uniref:toxin co-regulated pilus biosynthesis Q family protein n=1 Tax=Bordetella pertussis TaxID=520 RepID=UPI000A65AC14
SRPPPPRFRAAPPDLTLRAVLARWARAAGWTFEAEHWALDVDIPLAGKAELPGDFKTAVRALPTPRRPCAHACSKGSRPWAGPASGRRAK